MTRKHITDNDSYEIVKEHMEYLLGEGWDTIGPLEIHRKSAAMRLSKAIFQYGKVEETLPIPRCVDCETIKDLFFAPCPLVGETHEDYTDIYLCDSCATERFMSTDD